MPDISKNGDILPGRGRVFLDDSTVIGQVQSPDGKWRVSTWEYPNGQPSKVADKGCSAIAARAGHWRAWLNGELFPRLPGITDAPVGLLAELQSARGIAADDGTIGLVLDFHAGLGLRLLAADGTSVDVPDAFPRADSTCIVSRFQAFWMDHAAMPRTIGMPVPMLLPGPVYWPQVLRIHGEWWITYHSTDERGIVLHPFDSFEGYQITKPPAFYLAARVVASGVLIAWGTDPGDERIGQRVIDVTREPRQILTQPAPEPKPDPKPEDPVGLPDDNVAVQIVNEERARFTGTLSHAQLVELQRRVAGRLNGRGYGPLGLLKKGGSNCLGYSCDVIGMAIPEAPGQAQWDIMLNVDEPAKPNFQRATWGRVGNVTVRELEVVPPITDGGTPPPPPPDGVRPGEKHAYVRDDEERDECDIRFTDGTQCDRTKADPIHQVGDTPPPPPPPGDLARLEAKIDRLSHHLGVR